MQKHPPTYKCEIPWDTPQTPPGIARNREWPRYCRKACWTKMASNGPNDHFGQNGLIPNWILAFARPKWTKMVHFGLKRSILVHLGPATVLWPFLNNYENRILGIFRGIIRSPCVWGLGGFPLCSWSWVVNPLKHEYSWMFHSCGQHMAFQWLEQLNKAHQTSS